MPESSRPLPPLDLIRGFESAARHLSFTKAAGELFLTQSAVSRQILSLEQQLGVKLFERKHRALALTEAGQSYLRTVSAVLEQLRDATRRLRETKRGHVLTVTTTISFASMWLVPRLARFRELNPDTDVRISATGSLVDLERDGVDLAVRDLRVDAAPPDAVHLMGELVCAVCSPEVAHDRKRPLLKPADLKRHTLLHYHDPGGQSPWISWAAWLEARGLAGLHTKGAVSFDYYDQVIQAARLGQGVALGRMSLVQRYVTDGALVVVFDEQANIGRAYYLVRAKDADVRPEVERFMAWMLEEVRRERLALKSRTKKKSISGQT